MLVLMFVNADILHCRCWTKPILTLLILTLVILTMLMFVNADV